jgi:putative membrane protein
MTHLLARWLVNAFALYLVAQVVPGIVIRGFGTAMISAAAFGLINASLGLVLKILGLPLTILSLGLFHFVVNALMLKLAAMFVPGFECKGCLWPLLGAILFAVLNALLKGLLL